MCCNIVINQQAFLPIKYKVTSEARMKDPGRQRDKKIMQDKHEKTQRQILQR